MLIQFLHSVTVYKLLQRSWRMKDGKQSVEAQLLFDFSYTVTSLFHRMKALQMLTNLFSSMIQNKSYDENGNAVHQNYRLESTNSNDRKSKQRRMKVCLPVKQPLHRHNSCNWNFESYRRMGKAALLVYFNGISWSSICSTSEFFLNLLAL